MWRKTKTFKAFLAVSHQSLAEYMYFRAELFCVANMQVTFEYIYIHSCIAYTVGLNNIYFSINTYICYKHIILSIWIGKQAVIYSSKEVLHHLDFFIFLSDILTNKF